MIYDCFIFNNELDLLDLRLHELNSVVDKFVLVESYSTFSGNPKPLYYLQNQARFAKFKAKIVHVVVSDMDQAVPAQSLSYFKPKDFQLENLGAWSREIHMRNAIKRGLLKCSDQDIILLSDLDEIPKAQSVKPLDFKPSEIVGFEQANYYYFLNCRASSDWVGTKAIHYGDLSKLDLQQVREESNVIPLKNAGWHFSFLGGYKSVIDKIKSFSHQEHNRQENLDVKRLKFNLENGLDIFSRPFAYHFVNIGSSYPKYVTKNPKIFGKYVLNHPQMDQNTQDLREEVFQVRSRLYWKELELKEVQKALTHYQLLYRQAIKYNPLYYLFSKIKSWFNNV